MPVVDSKQLNVESLKVPPHSIEAEQAVLGGLMLVGEAWDRIADRIVPTLDVRAALGLVAADPEIIGIVYATDVASSKEVRILHTIRAKAAPITYVGAAISDRPLESEARAFLAFTRGDVATAVLERHGFIVWK